MWGPQPIHMGWRELRIRLTDVLSECGQDSMGPRGVALQSKSRIRAPISPAPTRKSVVCLLSAGMIPVIAIDRAPGLSMCAALAAFIFLQKVEQLLV